MRSLEVDFVLAKVKELKIEEESYKKIENICLNNLHIVELLCGLPEDELKKRINICLAGYENINDIEKAIIFFLEYKNNIGIYNILTNDIYIKTKTVFFLIDFILMPNIKMGYLIQAEKIIEKYESYDNLFIFGLLNYFKNICSINEIDDWTLNLIMKILLDEKLVINNLYQEAISEILYSNRPDKKIMITYLYLESINEEEYGQENRNKNISEEVKLLNSIDGVISRRFIYNVCKTVHYDENWIKLLKIIFVEKDPEKIKNILNSICLFTDEIHGFIYEMLNSINFNHYYSEDNFYNPEITKDVKELLKILKECLCFDYLQYKNNLVLVRATS